MFYDYCYDSLKLFGDDDIITRIEYILNNGTEHDEQIKVYKERGSPEICQAAAKYVTSQIL